MSWSAFIDIPPGRTDEEIAQILEDAKVYGYDDCPEERELARSTALKCAADILGSRCVGGILYPYRVEISGHCNPGNAPQKGSSPDCIVVTVKQVLGAQPLAEHK